MGGEEIWVIGENLGNKSELMSGIPRRLGWGRMRVRWWSD